MTITKQFLKTVALPLAIAAYEVTADWTPSLPAGYTLVGTIKLAWPLGKLSPDNPFFGFVARDAAGAVFVAIRGTTSLDEWIDDFDAVLVNVGGFSVAEGFQHVFESLLPSLRAALAPADDVCFIGHSLGAAIALLAAASFRAEACVVFEAPRVGDAAWADHCGGSVGAIVRVSNTKDIVTHQPGRPLYEHPGLAAIFDGWKLFASLDEKLDVHREHSLEFACTPGVAGMGDPLVLVELS